MKNQYVVVTGASTGIGRETALRLDRAGYGVFAGVRRDADGAALRAEASDRLRPLRLDVTDGGQIDAAVATVREVVGGNGLFALVNNAGFNYSTAFEFTDEAKARQVMEVNFFGLYKTSQRFIPLLRRFAETGGTTAKLINIRSVGSVLGVPWQAFYHASKFAVLGFSESLRFELARQNIRVVAVLPGGIKTPFIGKTDTELSEAIAAMPEYGQALYGEGLRRVQTMAGQVERLGSPPDLVARAIQNILAARNPRLKHFVGMDARLIHAITRFFPERVGHAVFRKLFVG